uniref:AlNc14C37G3231 protein n=1 Tax=Albugo laibachii Nc14 TaxID=890382 RepID=F0W8V6_9STRA|nr:AlNc14C37G3231 [Albugo laibachii Nc14]|eukprot:CCA17567.1 AlNc14C37G3231 [Albugo laibachii Nc14]
MSNHHAAQLAGYYQWFLSTFPASPASLSADITKTASLCPAVVTSNTATDQSDSPDPLSPPSKNVDDTNASSSSPPTFNAPITKATRPILADIIKGHEEISNDKASTKAKGKAELPKPIASDLNAIDRLFEEVRPSWDVLSAHLTAAKPFVIPAARFSVGLETGQSFIRSPPALIQSFACDHGNNIVGELLNAGKLIMWTNFLVATSDF